MISGNRCTLALSKLDAFAAWASEQGYVREPTKGVYEVLRLRGPSGLTPTPRLPGRGASGQLLIYFVRAGSHRRHASCQRAGLVLVDRWIRQRERKHGVDSVIQGRA